MNWWKHAILSTTCAIIYMVFIAWLDKPEFGPLDLVALFLFSLPDLDLKSLYRVWDRRLKRPSKHRHWFWHSSIIPLLASLIALYEQNFAGVGTFCVVVGAHLLGDIKIRKGGKSGTYLIFVRKGERMTAKGTDAWFVFNILICLSVAIFCLFV